MRDVRPFVLLKIDINFTAMIPIKYTFYRVWKILFESLNQKNQ